MHRFSDTKKIGFYVFAFAAMLCFFSASTLAAARITIVNINAPGVGFNDPTPAQPVGGNPGTTIGQQRLIAFQFAADIWGATLDSNVEIRVRARFIPLACTANSATLGSAGAITVNRDFNGAEFARTWYPIALANKRANTALNPINDDINANFNSELGKPGCLEGSGFYLGLDGNPPPRQSSLVVVLLHEFAHGLGFQTFVNTANGTKLLGFDDIYMRYLFDNSIGKNWSEMTNAERVQSTINPRRVVWTGANVTAAVPQVLRAGTPVLRILTPPSIAGTYFIGTASFGRQLDPTGTSGQVVLVNDGVDTTTDGCTPFVNAAEVAGKIAFIDRGTCSFAIKARNAQDAGAIGVIIANNTSGFAPGLGGEDATITIPVVSVSQTDGNRIRAELANGVNVTFGIDPTVRAGADQNNRALIYTPNPREPGSSVSHYDTSATPNQLMEPAISPDLGFSVKPPQDLTLPLFRDEGWFEDVNGDGLPDNTDNSFPRLRTQSVVTRDCTTGEYLVALTITNRGTSTINNVQIAVAQLNNVDSTTLPQFYGTLTPGQAVTRTLRFPSSTGQAGQSVTLSIIGTETTTFTGGSFSSTSTKLLPPCQ